MLEALASAPPWLQWMVAIGTPIVAFFGRDVWGWWKEQQKLRMERDDKFVERRSSRADVELNRVLKFKDDLIAELKNTISEKNIEIRNLLEEVKLCRHEREQFSRQSGEQAGALAVANANLAHTKAELADAELEIANLMLRLTAIEPRTAVIEDAKGDAKQLYKKLEAGTAVNAPAPTT